MAAGTPNNGPDHRALRRPEPVKNRQISAETSGKKRINLALQGGGAHGAFTWGVLDELLKDGRIEIEGMSGTSAAPSMRDGRDGWRAAERRRPASGSPTSGARRAATATCRRSTAHLDRLFSLIPIR